MFSDEDAKMLKRKIGAGDVILFLGAGASHDSLNGNGKPIAKGKDLEKIFRGFLDDHSDDLDLGDLSEAVIENDRREFDEIMKDNFLDCTPSVELTKLFKYSWYRCYTINYDDSILKIPRRERVQKIIPFSKDDRVEEQRGFQSLQTIFLNGSILHPSDGYILSDRQFRAGIRNPSPWYKKCAEDFANRTFIFIGTELNEPIFKAHIEALQDTVKYFSKSFLISPSAQSDRKKKILEDYNIFIKSGTLRDFSVWLANNIGEQLTPNDIVASFGAGKPTSDQDIEVASSLREVGSSNWIPGLTLNSAKERLLARDFYSGMAPTWEIVANRIHAPLSIISNLETFLNDRAADPTGGITVVKGRAGSGKTTATMAALYELSRSEKARVFEALDQNSSVIEQAIKYIATQPGPKKFLYVPSLHLQSDYIDSFSSICERTGVELVGQVRQSDWGGRFGRRKRFVSNVYSLDQLSNRDYEVLAASLSKFAVAPEFRKLTAPNQVRLLKKSQRQLLILMLETTKQRAFEEIIESEFAQIHGEDAKAVFCIVALITISRSRLTVGEIGNIADRFGVREPFKVVLQKLDGMIDITSSNYLIGRHDLFVRHIIEKTAEHSLVKNAVVAILESFTVFQVPFVQNAGKDRGNIIKFLMRARFLQELFGRDSRAIVEEIYSDLEYAYQNDGHYWLHRGKYYQMRGDHEEALKYFYRSVEAHDNEFARHSLAQQKLIYCSTFHRSTSRLQALLNEGVAELERQIDVRDDAEDQYPIVALSNIYPKVLLNWGLIEDAKDRAKEYFERLKVFDRSLAYEDASVREAMRFCAHVATQGRVPRKTKHTRNGP